MFIPKVEIPYSEQDKIIKLFNDGLSAQAISKQVKYTKKVIMRVLKDNGINWRNNAKYKLTDNENKDKLIQKFINNSNGHSNIKLTKEYLLQFDDLYKVGALKGLLLKRCPKNIATENYIKAFINKFYYDKLFNKLYVEYNEKYYGKIWANISLDHKTPLSRGGTWDLENLQIISWAENRAKYKYTQEEWNYIKNKYFKEDF